MPKDHPTSKTKIRLKLYKLSKKSAGKIYPINTLFRRIEIQSERIASLEKRNDEWAAEVRQLRGDDKPQEIIWPAKPGDIIKARKVKQYQHDFSKHKPNIGFVIPPADPGSGGHTTLFRFIDYLEKQGYNCQLFIYDPMKSKKPEVALEIIKKHFQELKCPITYGIKDINKPEILFASNWTTAYPVINSPGNQTKFYFVQDMEPFFEPTGSYSNFAENTYKFGLYGITAGHWLSDSLGSKYGMECEAFNFGVDTKIYKNLDGSRKDICFYARPGSPRRGFEVGVLVLEELHKKHPNIKIHCFGGDLFRYKLPFPYEHHGTISPKELNKLYNKCKAGLVFSFTNMSLIPQEMLAAGCIPIINKGENNKKVFSNPYVAYVEPDIQTMVEACEDILLKKPAAFFKKAAESDGLNDWQHSWQKVEDFMIQKASL